jgi:uncharacterized protein YjiK
MASKDTATCRLLWALIAVVALVRCTAAEDGPTAILFPYDRVGNIDQIKFRAPSGLAFHPGRGTLFVVGDKGDLCEMETNGALVQAVDLGKLDLEGIAVDPATGLLYLAVEGEERILEVDPQGLELRRTFDIRRTYGGKSLIKKGREGIEGIVFVADESHPEGGVFFIANQAHDLAAEEDISAIFQVALPLRSGKGDAQVSIERFFVTGISDMSGLAYDAKTEVLYIISDSNNSIFLARTSGVLLKGYALPEFDQEGIAFDANGNAYIARDSGGIIRYAPRD